MTRSGMKEAPALERQGYTGSKVLEHQNPNRNSNNLLEEEVTMNNIVSLVRPHVESESASEINAAIREHCKKSKLSVTALAIMAKIPANVLTSKLTHPSMGFTVREVADIARVLGLDPHEMLTPPDPEPTLNCSREICSVRHHQQFEDGRQGDMCRIDGIDSHQDLWDVFALSNGAGERWDAAIDLTRCDDLEGDAGITVMREALAAFAKAQAYCNVLNESEGLN